MNNTPLSNRNDLGGGTLGFIRFNFKKLEDNLFKPVILALKLELGSQINSSG